jgi:FixJ family two-component response regulator
MSRPSEKFAHSQREQDVSAIDVSNNEIFVVDDDPEMRDALAFIFTQAGFRVTAFTDGRSVIRATQEALPACILLDMYLPNESGLDILKQLDAAKFAAPIFIISGRGDIPTAVAAVKNGAFDFLEKQMDAETIVARVRKAVDAWARGRQNGRRGTVFPSTSPNRKPLTPREHEVLAHIAAGATNREAAASLGISPRTVDLHRAHIMHKLGARNSADLVRIVLGKGLKL